MPGVPGVKRVVEYAATGAVNGVAKSFKSKKKPKKNMGQTYMPVQSIAGVVAAPNNVDVVVNTSNQKVLPYISEFQILTVQNSSANQGPFEWAVPLTPWNGSANDAGPAVVYDPMLLGEFRKHTEYRLRSAIVKYNGGGQTGTNSSQVYIGSAIDAATFVPEIGEDFSALEKSQKHATWHQGPPMKLLHDKDWHIIDPNLTFNNVTNGTYNLVDMKNIASGILFLGMEALPANSGNVSFVLTLIFDFRGRNPLYNPGTSIFSATTTSPATADLTTTDISVGSSGSNNFVYDGTLAATKLITSAGYYLVTSKRFSYGTTATATGAQIIIYDVTGTNVTVARRVWSLSALLSGSVAMTVVTTSPFGAGTSSPTQEAIRDDIGIYHCKQGDAVALPGTMTFTGTGLTLAGVEVERLSKASVGAFMKKVDATAVGF